jgi:hypothetical protein
MLSPKKVKMLTIDNVLQEWNKKHRRMGCVAATNWFIKYRPDFQQKRINQYTSTGDFYSHVVATNGLIDIDLAPYANKPKEER